ncbi:hypothetical protein QYM36_001219 [Artemia franciscana]|uniref:ATP-dependent DNA helicase n=1 Tax=Artemia franciscana TaxID=6661 RepID=A0AA88LJY6_ARTSF|nr:hypothetical protein QYM36_001219 [Artemia franciscana]
MEKERKRQDVEFRQKKKETDRIEKERKRQETEIRQNKRRADRAEKEKKRQDVEFRQKEKETDRIEKERKRQDVEFRQKEKETDRMEKERKRQETEIRQNKRRADRAEKEKKRQDVEFRQKEKETDRIEKERKRQDVEFRQKEKETDRIEKERKRQETEIRQNKRRADRAEKRKKRQDVEFCQKEKETDMIEKERKRQDVEFRQKEKETDRIEKERKRQDVKFCQKEKETNRIEKERKRQDVEFRQKEKETDRIEKERKRAGTGKTQVLKAIVQLLLMIHKKDIEHDPEKTTILLCAPTGKAACNIGGSTLHYALTLPVSQGMKNFKDLTADKLNQLRVKLTKLKLLITDEVSMVGANMFKMINRRLKQIMGTQQDFGGVSILFFGDLYQLRPVADRYVFQPPTSPYEALLPNFWQDNVIMFELDEIMRQKEDKKFAEALNRLRTGDHTEEDIQLFQTSKVVKAPLTVPHLFMSNTSVDKFNAVVRQNLTTEKKHYTAIDSVKGDVVQSVKQYLLEKVKHLPISETQGLPFDLRLVIKERVELTVNIEVIDNLANGSGGTVQALSDNIIWILFNDKNGGKITRNNFKSRFPNEVLRDWTPMFRTVRMFRITKKEGTEIERFQFPLRPSSAKTVHIAQGDTLEEVAIDLTGSRAFPHIHYVFLSRAKSLQGLKIVQLNETKISVSPDVQEEIKRLRQYSPLSVLAYFTPKPQPSGKFQSVTIKPDLLHPGQL